MSRDQTACSALDWDSQFLPLLDKMAVKIHETKGSEKITLARYQTAFAIAGYVGTRAKELLHLRWSDFLDKTTKDLLEFKTGKKRKVYYSESLLRKVKANFTIVNPASMYSFILESSSSPEKPITTRAFNKYFAKMLEQLEIKTDNPSSHTLRKTFAQRVFKQRGETEDALIFLSEILNHSSIAYTRTYLGIRKQQIKEAYLTLD